MLFTTEVSALNTGLAIVTRALAARSAKQILECVLLEARGETLTLTCSDGNLMIRYTLCAEIKEEGSVALQGRLFTEMCRKMPGGNLTVQQMENGLVRITCLRSRMSLMSFSAAEYPLPEDLREGVRLSFPQRRLREMINRVVFAVGTDENRPLLTGCHMEVTGDLMRLVALDGFRLSLQNLPGTYTVPDGGLKATVPGRAMAEMAHILDDTEEPAEIVISGGHLQAAIGSTVLNTVLLAGEYVDYKRILPTEFATKIEIRREDMFNAVERCSLIAREGKNNLIRLEIEGDMMNITSNAETGDAREEMAIISEGDPLTIAFNAKYINDVLRNIPEEEIRISFNKPIHPCVITPMEGDAFLYLILPVRVNL